ncbi:hypothetical protein GXW82_01290 [Streptacidiphilus sp. 4-A2]|nr:hypothetical protein [Streptacidiphilus sp. 4-A2]
MANLEGAFSHSASPSGTPSAGATGGPSGWASQAVGNTLVTNPTSELTSAQIGFLRQVAARTWSFLSGPDLDPATHLLLDSVPLAGQPGANVQLQPAAAAREYTNPSLIGTTCPRSPPPGISGWRPRRRPRRTPRRCWARSSGCPSTRASSSAGTAPGTARPSPPPRARRTRRDTCRPSTNGWLAQGLLVTEAAFPALASDCASLLGAMQWQLLYDRADNVLYNGYQVGGSYSKSTYLNAYSGPRIAEYAAIGAARSPDPCGGGWTGHRPPATGSDRRRRARARPTPIRRAGGPTRSSRGTTRSTRSSSCRPSTAACTRRWPPTWSSPSRRPRRTAWA